MLSLSGHIKSDTKFLYSSLKLFSAANRLWRGLPEENGVQMINPIQTVRDTPWQSIRLAIGAAVLVLAGLAVALLDGNHHPSAALSSQFVSSSR